MNAVTRFLSAFRALSASRVGLFTAVLLAWHGLAPLTGSADTTSTVLAADFVTYIQDKTLTVAYKATKFAQFGVKGKLPNKSSKTFQYTRYERLPLPQSAIVEGVTPASTTMSITTVTATVDQWGQVVVITDIAELVVKHPVVQKAMTLLGLAAAELRDREIQKVLQAGTNIQIANGKAGRANLLATDVVTTNEMRKTVANLRNNGALPASEDSLRGIIDPSVEMDMTADPTWVAAGQYSNIKALYMGEVGQWMGTRFVRSNFVATLTGLALAASSTTTVGGSIATGVQVFSVVTAVDNNTGFETQVTQQTSSTTGAGSTNKVTIAIPATAGFTYNVYAGTVSGTLFLSSIGNLPSTNADILTVPVAGNLAPAPPATGVVVHFTWIMGEEGFAVVDLDGMSLQTYATPKGSTDSDPLQQRRKVGWKMAFKSVICNNNYLRRIESGSAF